MVGMQTRCLLLDLNREGNKAQGKNSRQELAVRGNKRQREDATVGVDGG